MKSNFFFSKKNYKFNQLYPKIKKKKNFLINDIKPLYSAQKNDITFFDSIKYKDIALTTKAGFCITTDQSISNSRVAITHSRHRFRL